MIEMTAMQFMEIMDKLPNPSSKESIQYYEREYRVLFLPDVPKVEALINTRAGTIPLCGAHEIRFRLNAQPFRPRWEPVETIVIKTYNELI